MMDWVWAIIIAAAGLTLSIWGAQLRIPNPSRRLLTQVFGSAATLALTIGVVLSEKIQGTAVGVIIAVLVSAILFVGANKWFDLVDTHWPAFAALTGAIVTGTFTVILVGSNILELRTATAPEGSNLGWLIILGGMAAGGEFGWLLAQQKAIQIRLVIGVSTGVVMGVLAGLLTADTAQPTIGGVNSILWMLVGAVVLGAISWFSNRSRTSPAMFDMSVLSWAALGAGLGWTIGVWGFGSLGDGSTTESVLAFTVGTVGICVWTSLRPPASYERRVSLAQRSRAFIFLAPALGFIAATLVIPTLRTIYLSFLDRGSEEVVGLKNYADVFTDPGIVKISGWSGIFGSNLFLGGMGLVILGAVLGFVLGRNRGHTFEPSGASLSPIALGAFLVSWAVFASLRGTIFNNLWWVTTVTLMASALGLAVAVLADRARYESVAKSIIFMPMAISFVGAGIIWRFMYIARPPSKNQTGVMNSVWVGLGELSNSTWPKWIAIGLLVLLVGGLGWVAFSAFQHRSTTATVVSLLTILPVLWLLFRLLGPGLGGFEIDSGGELDASPVFFLTEGPFNNIWMMVVLIWIQTGFTMVIFSAAIKAVPSELIEAARVDGATESQTFWRVTIPQIAPTIGVVVTTLIVLVTKVFDIVKVMTNGNFDTQVLANEMWQRAFTEFNVGLGSALAVILFVSVLPIMYINIRRMQKQAA